LIEAVFRAEIAQLSDRADALLATRTPVEALREWMDGFAAYARAKRELAGALRALGEPGELSKTQSRPVLGAAAQRILDAGIADGSYQRGTRGDDVVAALVGIFLVNRDPEEHAQAERLMDLLLAGVSA
jgi:hypothetical protein